MKILLLKQSITDQTTLNLGQALAKQWCATINLPLDFTQQDTIVLFKSILLNTDVVTNGYQVDPAEIFQVGKTYGDYDAYCLTYDWTKVSPQPTNPSDGGQAFSIPMQWYETYPEVFAQTLLHELCHLKFSETGKTDITHLLSNGTLQAQYPQLYAQFKELQPQEYYLYILNQFVTTPMQTYKYFNPTSDPLMVGVSPTLMHIADTARGIAGVPFKITSGLRTTAQNTSVGGVTNSSHVQGLALDIACTDMTRGTILKGLLTCGSPLFIEDAPNHIHFDIDSNIHTLGNMMVSVSPD